MSMSAPDCPACRITMQEGFILDLGHHSQPHVTKWAEGRAEKGFLGLKTKHHRQLETVTFRCPKCGWLIWFAPEPSSTSA